MRLLLTVLAVASSVSFAAPTPSEEGGLDANRRALSLEAPWVVSTLNAQRQTCVYDVCPRVLVEGAGTSVVNGVYYPDTSLSRRVSFTFVCVVAICFCRGYTYSTILNTMYYRQSVITVQGVVWRCAFPLPRQNMRHNERGPRTTGGA